MAAPNFMTNGNQSGYKVLIFWYLARTGPKALGMTSGTEHHYRSSLVCTSTRSISSICSLVRNIEPCRGMVCRNSGNIRLIWWCVMLQDNQHHTWLTLSMIILIKDEWFVFGCVFWSGNMKFYGLIKFINGKTAKLPKFIRFCRFFKKFWEGFCFGFWRFLRQNLQKTQNRQKLKTANLYRKPSV